MTQLNRPFQEGDPTEEDQEFVEGEPIHVPLEPHGPEPQSEPTQQRLEAALVTVLGWSVAGAQVLYTQDRPSAGNADMGIAALLVVLIGFAVWRRRLG